MQSRKFILPGLIILFSASFAFGQSEMLKGVINNLAFYKQKKDLKYLSNAKKSVDSLIKTHADSLDLKKNVYKSLVYSSILYIDSLNKLNQPAIFFTQTVTLTDNLQKNKRIYKYQTEIDFAKRCLANVFMRKGFEYVRKSDYNNAILQFNKAQQYVPDFKQLNAYIAYCNSKIGNLQQAVKFYDNLLKTDSNKAEYIETTANIYKSLGDTAKALMILQKGRKFLPNDRFLLFDEANIYTNKRDFKSLEPLLPQLLDNNNDNTDIAVIAANCYDHLNEFDKAESLYLHVIELNSSLYDPVYSLGLIYFREGLKKQGDDAAKDLGMAEQWLKKANEIAPNEEKCLQVLKLVYLKTGNQTQVNNIDSKLKQLN